MSASHASTESLPRLRQEIASVDRSIVLLLAARLDAAQRALRARTHADRRVTDHVQERRVLDRAHRWARELDLPIPLVDSLFRTLMEEGKTRFASGRPLNAAPPFVTVLVPAPEAEATGLRNHPPAQFVPVATAR